jgi:RNA polymerase sigma factor (sigma-70 family)
MSDEHHSKKILEHAEVFVEHYDQLLRLALYLCHSDRAMAEDLVQTAYIQFVTYHPELQALENPLAYLRRLVANVHKNQLVRSNAQKRGGVNKAVDLLLIDELASYSVTGEQKAQDLLMEIAYFASQRRLQSKTGVVVILRFLLGYFPKEIAQVLMVSIFAVNNLIMRGRQELKEFLKKENRKSKTHSS